MGIVDSIVEKMKLLKGGKTRRTLFKAGIVDANGVATVDGRRLARRLMAEAYVADNAEEIAKDLGEFAKVSKAEADEDDN